jgi:hypothetical protein
MEDEMVSIVLYGVAIVLIIYVAVSVVRTGRFKASDALALLGIVVSIIIAIGVPLPNIFKEPIPTIDPAQPLLSDNFDTPQYNGKYNSNLWICDACAFGVMASQGDSLIRLEATNGNGGLIAQSSWFSYQIDYIQGGLNLQNTDSGEINLGFHTTLDSSNPWFADCFIKPSQKTKEQALFACSIFTYIDNQYKGEYETVAYPVNYDEWHIAKVDLVQPTLELYFYLDGKLIGKHIPIDADELKNKIMGAGFGISTDTHIVGYVDDVTIQPAK